MVKYATREAYFSNRIIAIRREELESSATEDRSPPSGPWPRPPMWWRSPASVLRASPLPEHLRRERVVEPGPTVCLCCGSPRLPKLGEDITETLEVIPRQWKVIQPDTDGRKCSFDQGPTVRIHPPPATSPLRTHGHSGTSARSRALWANESCNCQNN
jgi:hypothetical protein